MNKRQHWLCFSTVALAGAAACVTACSQPQFIEVPDDPDPDASAATNYARDGSSYDVAPSPDSGLGDFRFTPTAAFSGYDGTHTFKVPIAVYDSASDLKVVSPDTTAATVVPTALTTPTKNGITDNGKYFMVTILKPGNVTIDATSGGKTVKSVIAVASYDPARWQAGQTRYVTGGTGTNTDPPCTQCHVQGQAIDHSPAALATVSDAKIATTITTGISPAGFPIQGVTGNHRWTVTDTERDGLITYLRALDPRGFQ